MIIDASVAFKVLVEEEGTDAAKVLIADHEGVAPHLILSEIGNALWKATRRGELRGEEIGARLETLPELLTIIDESDVIARAVELAVELDHPIYDCVYLAMAEDRGERLLTADQMFARRVAATPYAALMEVL